MCPPACHQQLLERRPDIQEAEQNLVAANAQIGVARAQLFPQISLTGTGGVESIGLGNIFTWRRTRLELHGKRYSAYLQCRIAAR